jgi:hypothetical protein
MHNRGYIASSVALALNTHSLAAVPSHDKTVVFRYSQRDLGYEPTTTNELNGGEAVRTTDILGSDGSSTPCVENCPLPLMAATRQAHGRYALAGPSCCVDASTED